MVSSKPDLRDVVAAALREDLGGEMRDADITTHFVVDADPWVRRRSSLGLPAS